MFWNELNVLVNEINEYRGISWDEYLEDMFDRTGEDGTLYVGVNNDDPDDNFGEVRIYKCKMEWSWDAVKDLEASIRKTIGKLRAISRYWEDLHDEEKDPEDIFVGTDLYEVWKTFMEPLPDVEMLNDVAADRVGPGMNPYGVIYRARRVYQLYGLGAVDFIIEHEKRNLAQALAIHKCCKEIHCEGKVAAEE